MGSCYGSDIVAHLSSVGTKSTNICNILPKQIIVVHDAGNAFKHDT